MSYTGICCDSREARPGCLFVCLRGHSDDGHVYARRAYDAGCRDFLAEREIDVPADANVTLCADARAGLAEKAAEFFGHPARSLVTVGVTGTKGKTGTVFAAASMLSAAGIKCGTIGTLGIDFDGVHYDTPNTTPDAVTFQRALAQMKDLGVKVALVEVSSQALKERRVAGMTFDIGVFTNFSPDHISACEHADVEEYRSCKAKLFSVCRTGLFNADDAEYGYFVRSANCEALSYGISPECAFRAEKISFFRDGERLCSSFDFIGTGIKMRVVSSLPGIPGVYNTLCASSVCALLGAGADAIARGAENIRVPGRYELYKVGGAYAMIDYAHNGLAVKSLFDTVALYGFSRVVSVFGCGGERSVLRRREMADAISRRSDICVVTEDNPRSESLESINADIARGITAPKGRVEYVPERKAAIEYALTEAKTNDIVLLIGKGHERYMEKNGRKLPFCEADIVKEFTAKLRDN